MRKSIIFFYLTALIACSDKTISTHSLDSFNKENIETVNDLIQNENRSTGISLDSLWTKVTSNSSCLTGGQYQVNGKFNSEGCILDHSEDWEILFNSPKSSLTEFLITKLEKSDTTAVHTCPFFLATEGELAIYALQRVYNKNWFDFDEFKIYKERADSPQAIPLSNRDNFQGWLQDEVLQNPEKRDLMKNLWAAEMNK